MPIKLNSSGGGSVTLDVPSTASAFTLTAPARTGNIITNNDTGTISSGMIASGAVTSSAIASGAVTSSAIASGAVTTSLIAAGSAGQGLVTNSGGSTAWVNGPRTLLDTLTASGSASISTTNLAGYRYIEILYSNIVPVTINTILELRWYSSSAYQTTGYQNYLAIFNTGGSAAYAPTTYVDLSGGGRVSNVAGNGHQGRILLLNANQSTGYKQYLVDTAGWDGAGVYTRCFGGGTLNVTAAITGFQMFMSSGNISTGVARVWGWN